MDLKKFEYQRAEYVKAFKIVGYAQTINRLLPNYFLLDSGMPNMPFAVPAPPDYGSPVDAIGKYFIMYDDGGYLIQDKTTFELEFIPKT